MAARNAKTARPKQPSGRRLDEQIEESFPASDPPSFMGGKHVIGAPGKRETPMPGVCKPKKKRR
ncbi:MAG TPA: hypothetical protein VGM17_15955 [Rhizomicrobium sp.]|jgi:hypothetical protein